MAITIGSESLEAVVTPERGADIVQLTDLATGTPLFAESPTRRVGTRPGTATDSVAEWLRGYPGGWQLLVPNAGPERVHDGVRQGYHGEASLAGWDLLSHGATSCELETRLLTSPLRLRRRAEIAGDTLTVTDQLENLSPDPVHTRIVQHPAFGAPFLDDRSYVVASAATVVTDAEAPGTLAGRDVVGAPGSVLAAGPVPGSIRLPGPGSGESLFAALTAFATPEATFCSPTAGLAVRLAWDGAALPHGLVLDRGERRQRLAVVPPALRGRRGACRCAPGRGRRGAAPPGRARHAHRRRRDAHPHDLPHAAPAGGVTRAGGLRA